MVDFRQTVYHNILSFFECSLFLFLFTDTGSDRSRKYKVGVAYFHENFNSMTYMSLYDCLCDFLVPYVTSSLSSHLWYLVVPYINCDVVPLVNCPDYKIFGCKEGEFRCHSGQCIAQDEVCFFDSTMKKGCKDRSHLNDCGELCWLLLLLSYVVDMSVLR